MKKETTDTTYCLISTSQKSHIEIASKQWEKADNTQIAEVTNTNCKQVLIFIDGKWERLKKFDKNTLICTISGLLFDKATYKQTGHYDF